MKLLLLKDLPGKGKKGQVIDVSDGYAHNFVLKNKVGIPENDPSAKKILKEQKEHDEKLAREKARMEKLKTELEHKPLNLHHTLSKDGKVYGSIKEKELVDYIAKQFGATIDKHQIKLPKFIKGTGSYTAIIDLGFSIKATLHINVQ